MRLVIDNLVDRHTVSGSFTHHSIISKLAFTYWTKVSDYTNHSLLPSDCFKSHVLFTISLPPRILSQKCSSLYERIYTRPLFHRFKWRSRFLRDPARIHLPGRCGFHSRLNQRNSRLSPRAQQIGEKYRGLDGRKVIDHKTLFYQRSWFETEGNVWVDGEDWSPLFDVEKAAKHWLERR
jgi:hypothetical protein